VDEESFGFWKIRQAGGSLKGDKRKGAVHVVVMSELNIGYVLNQ
jgi:hypothetical protein